MSRSGKVALRSLAGILSDLLVNRYRPGRLGTLSTNLGCPQAKLARKLEFSSIETFIRLFNPPKIEQGYESPVWQTVFVVNRSYLFGQVL